VPSFTFASTAEVVALLGAAPIFVDVLEDSFNIDPANLDAAALAVRAAGELRPAGVIPVDLFGQPADYAAVQAVANRHGLWVMADAAQSFGAKQGGRGVGTLAETTTTSFFPAKPLGCYGDGGAIFTDDDGMAEVLRSIRMHGKGTDKYDNARIGINGRLDTIQAAVLIEKLAIFGDEIDARQRIAERYDRLLRDVARVPAVAPGSTSAWAQYTLVLDDRDRVAARLKEKGVPTAVYYPKPLHEQTAYRRYPTAPNRLPVSTDLSRRVLSLPMHPYLDEATQDRIVEAVRGALA
jgi:dTDP-4-amino-4,6-dideoxygalactose transaminase